VTGGKLTIDVVDTVFAANLPPVSTTHPSFPKSPSIAVTPEANSIGVNYASDKFPPLPNSVSTNYEKTYCFEIFPIYLWSRLHLLYRYTLS
jgi:hypothetical protein